MDSGRTLFFGRPFGCRKRELAIGHKMDGFYSCIRSFTHSLVEHWMESSFCNKTASIDTRSAALIPFVDPNTSASDGSLEPSPVILVHLGLGLRSIE